MDTPRICFQPYPKNMDTYWLRYGYPTRIREGGARGGEEEELRKEGLHGPRAPPRPDPPELGAAELEVGELDAAELTAEACAVPRARRRGKEAVEREGWRHPVLLLLPGEIGRASCRERV